MSNRHSTKPIPYEEVSTPEFGESAARTWSFALEPPDDPQVVVLRGTCPRCFDAATYDWPLRMVRGAPLPEPVSKAILVTVICFCDVTHPRAGGKKGCGGYWEFKVPRT